MKMAGAIEFTITEWTPERVSGEMPVKAGTLNRSRSQKCRCQGGDMIDTTLTKQILLTRS